MSQSVVAQSKHICLQQCFKMFVADVKCSQVTWQTVLNQRACSTKASLFPKLFCIRGSAQVIRERPKGLLVAFRDQILDVIIQVGSHLTAQCLVHQTGKFELHSLPNRKPVWLTQHRRNVAMTSRSGDACCAQHSALCIVTGCYMHCMEIQSLLSSITKSGRPNGMDAVLLNCTLSNLTLQHYTSQSSSTNRNQPATL